MATLTEDQIAFIDACFPSAVLFFAQQTEFHFAAETDIAGRAGKLVLACLNTRDAMISMLQGAGVMVTQAQGDTMRSQDVRVSQSTPSGNGNKGFNQRVMDELMSKPDCPICQNDKRTVAGSHCAHFHYPPHGTLAVPPEMR